MPPAAWSVFGLPAHALVVHLAVVLVPLAAIALLLTGWRAAWRRQYSLAVVLVAVVGAVAAFIANQSGEALERNIKQASRAAGGAAQIGDHPQDGQRAWLVALAFAVAAVAFWAIDRWWERWRLPRWSPLAAYGIAFVPALAAITVMVVAGHSGAQLVWKDLGNFVTPR